MVLKVQSLTLGDKSLTITFALTSFLSFAIPFSFGHPQIIVGSLVNAFLFLAALFFPTNFIYPLIFFPSLAVLSRGIIFGPLTPFLIFMIPFIWIGNSVLVFSFRRLLSQNKNYWFSALAASGLKAIFLFSASLFLFKINAAPRLFLSVMGYSQFITACFGALATFLAGKIIFSRNKF